MHHAPGSELVVLGVDEAAGDGFEGLDEAGEVVELVERLGLGQGDGVGIMARAQLDQRRGRDGAFEMQMQFSLGQAADERGDIVHLTSLRGESQAARSRAISTRVNAATPWTAGLGK